MSQGGAGAGALAANGSEPGAFPLLKTTEPAPALLPKKGWIPEIRLGPATPICGLHAFKEDSPKTDVGQK